MTATATMDEPIARGWWRHAGMRRGGAALAVLGLAAVGIGALRDSGAMLRIPRDQVMIASVEQGIFRDSTAIQGKAVPRDTIILDAAEGGRVEEVLARPGDRLVKEQPIVRFSNTQLELDILSQEGRLIESITQLQAYQQQLERNREDSAKALAEIDFEQIRTARAYDRRLPLSEKGFVRREEMDRFADELASINRQRAILASQTSRENVLRQRQLPQIAQQLVALNASLEITRAKLDSLTVRAPVTGQLAGNALRIGENRQRGDRLGEIILDTGFRIHAEIDEFYLARVRMGQTARLDSGGDDVGLAVRRVYPQVQNGRFAVDLEFSGPVPKGIVAGMTLRGNLSLGRDTAALVLRPGNFLTETGGRWVFVVGPDGTSAQRRNIRIGRRNGDQLEVLSGLKAGERVIISGYEGWNNVQRIKFEN